MCHNPDVLRNQCRKQRSCTEVSGPWPKASTIMRTTKVGLNEAVADGPAVNSWPVQIQNDGAGLMGHHL